LPEEGTIYYDSLKLDFSQIGDLPEKWKKVDILDI
jgi:hypothetical protein